MEKIIVILSIIILPICVEFICYLIDCLAEKQTILKRIYTFIWIIFSSGIFLTALDYIISFVF